MKPKRKIFFTMLGASLAFAGCLTAFGLSMNISTQDKNGLSDEPENNPLLENVDSGDYCCTDNGYNDNAVSNNADRNISTFGQNIISKFLKSNSKTEQVNNTNENKNYNSDNNTERTNNSIVNAVENSQEKNSQENTNEDSQSQSDVAVFDDSDAKYVGPISYIDGDGNEQVCACARVITKDDAELNGYDTRCNGFYVVNENIERSGDDISGVKCKGDVKVIIEKNCTYKVKADCGDAAAINVTGKNSFTLYSQVKEAKDSPENGTLYVQGDDGAGIGGNPGEEGCNIYIYGCVVEYFREEAIDSAGIGGGDGKSGHDITIKRAVIKSEMYQYYCVDGAGIGGGDKGEGKDVNITDCIFKDTSFWSHGAFIGGGNQGSGHNITIRNTELGDIKSLRDDFDSDGLGAVIGGGEDGAGYDIELIDCSMNIRKDGDLDGTGAIIGGGDEAEGYNIKIEGGCYDLFQNYDDDPYTDYGTASAAAIGGGENAAGHDITIKGSTIKATGGRDSAAIGGGQGCKGYNITIENSNVTAQGGEDGAGIGGGDNSLGYGIKIKGGDITARGGENGAGIGCGDDAEYKCSQDELDNAIIIEEGFVKAYGGGDAAGIGGGSNPNDWCVLGIHIKGGTVNAYGGSGSNGGGGAGIGGGNDNDGKVRITGGTVWACGGGAKNGGGAGIGGGESGNGDVSITGGAVWGYGGSGSNGGGAGIGGGNEGYGIVDIYDGAIYAYGGNGNPGGGAGIGGGDDDDDDSDKRSAIYLHAPARIHAERGSNGDKAMPIGCGDGGNPPAIWAFPGLNISKCIGTNWTEVDYSAKHSEDKTKADNLVNQVCDAEQIEIAPVTEIESDMIEPIPDQTAKSSAIEPLPVVECGSCTLQYGKDYNLRWEHNQSIGIGKVYVDGINNYKGTAEAEFNIVPSTQDKTLISYIENGQEKFVDALPYDSKYDSLSDGWYYVYGNVTVDHPITVNGDVNIILVDGASLNFNCGSSYPFVYADAKSTFTLHYQYLHRGMINTQRGRTQLNEVSFDTAHNVAYCNTQLSGNIDVSKITSATFITRYGQFSVDDLHFNSNHLNYSINIDKYKSVFKEGRNAYRITIGYDGKLIQIGNDLNIVKSNTANDQVTLADEDTCVSSAASTDSFANNNADIKKKDENYTYSSTNNTNAGTNKVNVKDTNNYFDSENVKSKDLSEQFKNSQAQAAH